ncbi:hypothetical protein AB6A40_001182 [Gnathostoma spinigerum]|uniref:Actin-related protein 10 n=1 Tax=Gnathostoma spinigerum TaxID=75299 RepID=A0ABD6ECD8_9BILA
MSSTGRSSRRSLSSLSSTRFDALSLGVGGADNRQPIVIEVGTKLTKVGYAGEFMPRAIIRTEVFDGHRMQPVFDKNRSSEDQYRILFMFFERVIFKNLLAVAKERHIVIVESVLEPTEKRNLIARVLFDGLDAPSVLFAPSHLMATMPYAASNALVIDIGFREAVVIPIIFGVTALNSFEVSDVGASRVERRVVELLYKYGEVTTAGGGTRKLDENDEKLLFENNVVEDIVVKYCFTTQFARGAQLRAAEYSPENCALKPPCDVFVPLGSEMLRVPGFIREVAAEILFEHNDDDKSLPQLIVDSVLRCPIDCRRSLLEGIITVGGLTKMPGFLARFRQEILALLSETPKLHELKQVRFFRLPDTPMELVANWVGGSLFGALEILPYRCSQREEWISKKFVPDWITNIMNNSDKNASKSR